jgi:tRNA (guanine10-N2)-methyltransferase
MWYLCVFYHRLLDYRRPEVESLAELFSTEEIDCGSSTLVEWKLPEKHHMGSPFHFVSLPSEDMARKIANRSNSSLSDYFLSIVLFYPQRLLEG